MVDFHRRASFAAVSRFSTRLRTAAFLPGHVAPGCIWVAESVVDLANDQASRGLHRAAAAGQVGRNIGLSRRLDATARTLEHFDAARCPAGRPRMYPGAAPLGGRSLERLRKEKGDPGEDERDRESEEDAFHVRMWVVTADRPARRHRGYSYHARQKPQLPQPSTQTQRWLVEGHHGDQIAVNLPIVSCPYWKSWSVT